MTTSDNWAQELAILKDAGVPLGPGLTATELAAAEERCAAPFPPDLRALLSAALPLGDDFPDWRKLDDPALGDRLSWPFEGISFDIEYNGFWWPEWGKRPADLEAALDIARRALTSAPTLIPIDGHRFLPAEPCQAGNPVLSVYQTDVIYYGIDLRNYLAVEFARAERVSSPAREPRPVPFWSDLVAWNDRRAAH